MTIARPITKTQISTVGWGIPVTDELNRLSTLTNNTQPGTFTTAVARDAAITAPVSGMHVWLSNTKQETVYNGTAWVVVWEPPTTFVPTFSGLVLNNGSVNLAKFQRFGGMCHVQVRVTMGSGSVVNGWLQVTNLPIPLLTGLSTSDAPITAASSTDISASSNYMLQCVISGMQAMAICWLGANNAMAFTGPTAPFTWASGDTINWEVIYPCNPGVP